MSLRTVAEADLAFILEDSDTGFGNASIRLVAPDETEQPLTGFSTDISQAIDPETGQLVSQRQASIGLRLTSVQAAFPTQGLPEGTADTSAKPWLVRYQNVLGDTLTFLVSESNPDREAGVITLIIEKYNEAT